MSYEIKHLLLSAVIYIIMLGLVIASLQIDKRLTTFVAIILIALGAIKMGDISTWLSTKVLRNKKIRLPTSEPAQIKVTDEELKRLATSNTQEDYAKMVAARIKNGVDK